MGRALQNIPIYEYRYRYARSQGTAEGYRRSYLYTKLYTVYPYTACSKRELVHQLLFTHSQYKNRLLCIQSPNKVYTIPVLSTVRVPVEIVGCKIICSSSKIINFVLVKYVLVLDLITSVNSPVYYTYST